MKRNQFLFTIVGLVFLLFVGTLLYAALREDDPYRYFTGLGEKISVAPDDSKIAFSYYVDGKESIYTANPDGSDVERITNAKDEGSFHPDFSPDGKRLVFLSENSKGTNTLFVIKRDGSRETSLTDNKLHVVDAIFSDDGKTIYFVAIESKEFKKGEESREGFDLFSIKTDGRDMKKLTDADHFSMDNLFLSIDGQTIYYSNFDGEEERIYSYSTEEEQIDENPSILPEGTATTHSFYEPQLSPDGEQLAFNDVSKESQDGSLFEYELFLLDLKSGNVERLTELKKAAASPVFFHEESKIAFLENTTWSNEPAVYNLMTVDLSTRSIEKLKLDTPQSSGGHQIMQFLDRMVNSLTLAILYTLLMSLLSVFLYNRGHDSKKPYLPAIVSFSIAILTFIISFVVAAMGYPWAGIGLGMLAVGILGCSIVIMLFTFTFKWLANRKQ